MAREVRRCLPGGGEESCRGRAQLHHTSLLPPQHAACPAPQRPRRPPARTPGPLRPSTPELSIDEWVPVLPQVWPGSGPPPARGVGVGGAAPPEAAAFHSTVSGLSRTSPFL